MAIIQKQLTATVAQPTGVSVDFLWEITSNPSNCATIVSGSVSGVNTPPYQVSVVVEYDDATCVTASVTCTLTESDKSTTGVCEQVINFNILVDETLYLPCEASNSFCYLQNYTNEITTYTINMTGQADGTYFIDFFNYHQTFESFSSFYIVPAKYTLKQNGTTLVETPYVLRNGSRYQTELGTDAVVGFWQNAAVGTFASPYIYTYGAYTNESTSYFAASPPYTIAPCQGFSPCVQGCSLIPLGLCGDPDPTTGDVNNYCYENAGRIIYEFDNNNGLLLELIVTPYSLEPVNEAPLNLIKAYCSDDPCCEDPVTITGPYGDNCYTITADTGHIYINGDYDTDINGEEICITCNGLLDAMFVIDISGSLNNGTATYRQDIIDLFDIMGITNSPSITDDILAGCIAFAGSQTSIFPTTPIPIQSTLADMQTYMQNVTTTNPATCPYDALNYAWQQLQIDIPGRNAPKVLIFISDGIMTSCSPNLILNLIADIRNSGIAVIGIKINNGYNTNFNCPGNFLGLNNSVICTPAFQSNHIIPVFSDSFASELPNINAIITALFGMSNYIVYECEPGCTTLYNLACSECIANPPVLTIDDGTCTQDGALYIVTDCGDNTIDWEVDSGSGFVSVGSTMPAWVEGNIYRARCVADDCESSYSNEVEAITNGCTVDLINGVDIVTTFTDSKLIFTDIFINGLSTYSNGWILNIVNLDNNPSANCGTTPDVTIYKNAGSCTNVPTGSNVYNFNVPSFFVPLVPGNYRAFLSCSNDKNCDCCYTDIVIECADCIVSDSFNSGTLNYSGTYENIYQFCIPCTNECFKIKFNAGGTVSDTITISTDPTFTSNILLETTNRKTSWYTIDLNNNSPLDYYEDGEICTDEKEIYIKIDSAFDVGIITTWEIDTQCCNCNDNCPSEDTFFPCATSVVQNVNDTITISLKSITDIIANEGLVYNDICTDCISTCNEFAYFATFTMSDLCVNSLLGNVNFCNAAVCNTYLSYTTGTPCVNNPNKLLTNDTFTVTVDDLSKSFTFAFNNLSDANSFYNWFDNVMLTENTTFCTGSGDKANVINIAVFDSCGDGGNNLYLSLFSNFYDDSLVTTVPTLSYNPVTLIGSLYVVKIVYLYPLPNTCLFSYNPITTVFNNANGIGTGTNLQKLKSNTTLAVNSYWGIFANECKFGYNLTFGITTENDTDSWYVALYNSGCGLYEICGISYEYTYLVIQHGSTFSLPSGWILHPNATTALNDCFSCP